MNAVQITDTATDRGRITVATQAFAQGATVFQERPLVAIQSVFNKSQTLVCAACHRFVGDLTLQANLLTNQTSRVDLADATTTPPATTATETTTTTETNAFAPFSSYTSCPCVLCPQGCGEIYCSQECVVASKHQGHDLLCTGPHGADHPVVQFKTHAVSTNEIFLFAAVVAVEYMSRYKRSCNVAQAWQPFSAFVQLPWWDLVHAPADAASPEIFANQLKTIATESLELFQQAMSVQLIGDHVEDRGEEGNANMEMDWSACLGFLTVERWGQIVGMFEQNQIGIRVSSPLANVAKQMSHQSTTVEQSDHAMDIDVVEMLLDLADRVDEADGMGEEEGEEGEEGEACLDEFSCVPCAPVGATEEDNVEEYEEDEADEADEADAGNEYEEAIARMQLVAQMGDDYFPPLDGTALFTVGCSMNHSCAPNVSPVWSPDNDQPIAMHFVALKDIASGEELNFSYIDATIESVEERRELLRDYGFVCQCARCREEDQSAQQQGQQQGQQEGQQEKKEDELKVILEKQSDPSLTPWNSDDQHAEEPNEEPNEEASDDGGSWEDDDFDVVVPTSNTESSTEPTKEQPNTADDSEWFGTRTTEEEGSSGKGEGSTATPTTEDNRPPLLLVDLTVLSDGKLHNRFDINSVNDSDLKRQWTKDITNGFVSYRDNTGLIQAGTVRSCGQSVWREALQELRREYPGHFWAPIFPPK